MFAPKVAKPQVKAAANPIGKLAPRRSMLAARPFGGAAVGQVHLLQRSIGNQATRRLLAQRDSSPTGTKAGDDGGWENMTAREAPRGPSSDFSKIPVFPPDRVDRPQPSYPLAATPLPSAIQAKLIVGQADDPLEYEADRIADQVMRMVEPSAPPASGVPQVSHKSAACDDGEAKMLKPKPVGPYRAATGETSPIALDVLRSPGEPLDPDTVAFMEGRFERDFRDIRIHTDGAAAASAQAIDALAYTVGNRIVFGPDRYAPHTAEGRRLIAHELAHVVQPTSSPAVIRRQPSGADKKGRAGTKHLSKGWMDWLVVVTDLEQTETYKKATPEDRKEYKKKGTWATVQIGFKPHSTAGTVTFLQTVLQVFSDSLKLLLWLAGTPGLNPSVDALSRNNLEPGRAPDMDPFYGADWSVKEQKWTSEAAPPGFKNAPSGGTERSAHEFDEPAAERGTYKLFESVAIVPETGEPLGALRWGLGEGEILGAEEKDCTDAPSSDFGGAVKRFYTAPKSYKDYSGEQFDAIVDGFAANDGVAAMGPRGAAFSPVQKAAVLHADQEARLDDVAEQLKTLQQSPQEYGVHVVGFADPTEMDPRNTSDQRAQAVEAYLRRQGPPGTRFKREAFGAAWLLYPPDPKDARNRRVQIQVVALRNK